MSLVEALQRQWRGYPEFHASRFNLALHMIAVPAFLAGNLALVACLAAGEWIGSIASLAVMVGSIAAQGRGHKTEANPAIPFSGPADAMTRLLLEQWVSFPRFVLSGRWYRAYRGAR